MLKFLSRVFLGAAANAGGQVLDQDARLAMPPRLLVVSNRPVDSRDLASPKSRARSAHGLKLVAGGRNDRPSTPPRAARPTVPKRHHGS
ncbi:MAG: hypothetical protein ACKVP7_03110 [Hyphomicrobiaceae bacterium]